MFNEYYAQQEHYKDLIKEAEKERIIKQIKESNIKSNEDAAQGFGEGSLAKRIGLIFRIARPIPGR